MRNIIFLTIVFFCCSLLSACSRTNETSSEAETKAKGSSEAEESSVMDPENIVTEEQKWEKGFDLPVDDMEKKEAETDCKKMMELISELYINADKGSSANVVLPSKTIHQMVGKFKETGYPVTASEMYFNMKNYRKLEHFIKSSMDRKSGEIVVYEIHSDGGFGRNKFIFDGTDMYVLSAKTSWDDNNEFIEPYIAYNRIKEWKYSKKGWFCYKLCVPEYPEVSEVVDGSCLIRVKPMSKEERKFSKKCVSGLGYQGNNLLCSNWNINHMEDLDFNGMYEYLYEMKYHKKLKSADRPDGIPKAEFEQLIMEYLPITSDELQKYAVFNMKKQTYDWVRLGCGNYELTYFGTSVPEVTGVQDNHDGTVTLTVDAVCEMILCDDAVITHELTVRVSEDGSFQYLGNKILNNGIKNIPDYHYRITKRK